MPRPMPADLAADLVAAGLDPADYDVLDGRTPRGNGTVAVAKRASSPTLRAVFWTFPRPCWALKVSGRYASRPGTDDPLLFATAGAALAFAQTPAPSACPPPSAGEFGEEESR